MAAANPVAMNMKRKEHAELANHGFSIFVHPKRLKSQDGEIPEMMEEDKPSVGAPIAATLASWLLTSQGQEAAHDTVNTADVMASSSRPAFAAPMDAEADLRQRQPEAQQCQQAPFWWSGFF
ncbi:hypothetical protein GUJ93_ZPchr0008g13318 [Zizania palustris]|uniref:Uncharacterized protein n=1 Tax=Zizania palustris TaxID=103762 RepID=A0A8J5QYL5_ZIZPA|nr:hypothetical protein GUJ93_ZPchr0008g13318 [Zizania palustris]